MFDFFGRSDQLRVEFFEILMKLNGTPHTAS